MASPLKNRGCFVGNEKSEAIPGVTGTKLPQHHNHNNLPKVDVATDRKKGYLLKCEYSMHRLEVNFSYYLLPRAQ